MRNQRGLSWHFSAAELTCIQQNDKSQEDDNCCYQAISQACAVSSPFHGDFDCNGELTPIVLAQHLWEFASASLSALIVTTQRTGCEYGTKQERHLLMNKDKCYWEALREWRRRHAAEMFAVLDFIYLPEGEQAEILEQAYRLRAVTEAGLSTTWRA